MRMFSSNRLGRAIWIGIAWAVASAAAADGKAPLMERALSLEQAIEALVSAYPEAYPGTPFREKVRDFSSRLQALDGAGETTLKQAGRDLDLLCREALLAHPKLTGAPVLFVTRDQYLGDHHNTATLFQVGEINTGSFRGGGALKAIDFGHGGEVRVLLEAPEGIIRDPEVHFDGTRVVFSMRENGAGAYHVYEIQSDGSGLRQLTRAQEVSDVDPLYLSDGGIAFSSTREPKYCMCNRHIMANLHRMDPDGANIQQIAKSTLFEGHGAMLPDGRILYDRWEYVDRNFGDAQGLWTVYPDGSNPALFWGNNTNSPGGVIDARPLPDGERIICTFTSCHDRPWGAVALVDRRLGMDGRSPVVRTWPASAIDLVGVGDFDTFKRVQPKYEDPYPLDSQFFLCSRMTGDGERMGLYLIDVFGNELLLHEEDKGCFDPMPLAPRLLPFETPSRVNLAQEEGLFYVADVYRGTHTKGVERGSVKWLRVIESPEKRSFNPEERWDGQGRQNPAMNWHDFNNKRILGTVPVEEDGSACFRLPSDCYVYFQLLDAQGMMLQSMRSGVMARPGEQAGCVGCHENRRTAPPPATVGRLLATQRPPSTLDGWHGSPRLFGFMQEVQPVFDRYCVQCHDYGKEAGGKLNLAPDHTLTFNTAYMELWRKGYIAPVGAGPYQTIEAKGWGSHASKLVAVIQNGHQGVDMDQESWDRLVTWIDLNAPFYPYYETAYPMNLAGRAPLDNAQLARLTELTGVPFRDFAGHAVSRGPQVSFERPEWSPCLSELKKADPARYTEAVAILQAGRETLAKNPPAGMPGFQYCERDAQRDTRYAARRAVERQNREAILHGEHHPDL